MEERKTEARRSEGERGPRDGRGRGGRRDGRGFGRRREERGPTGFEAVALDFARAIDKPIVKGDFQAQLEPLENFVLATRKGGKSRSLEDLSEGTRGKLFTALLRVMRQQPVEDEENEKLRRKVFATLAEAWRALGDDRRAESMKEQAQGEEPAPFLLAYTGAWDKVAALHEREKRYREAAALYEENGRPEEAARMYQLAGDVGKMVEILVQSGKTDEVVELAKGLPPEQREQALLAAGKGDLLMDLLVQEERWEDVARLYERAEQFGDAARAWEKAGKTHKAIRAFDRSGETAEADRLVEAEVAAAPENEAARVYARFGRFEKAAERTDNPLQRFRWLRQAGKIEEAQAVAKAELEAMSTEERSPLELAPWMARAGDTAGALRIWDDHREPKQAAQVLEELEEWELAARCLETALEFHKAADFFEKAGNTAEAERVRALAPPMPKTAPARRGPRRGGKNRRPRA
ncbi:MAG TPA: hypothetical protein VKY51_01485 [Fredinandcohnia sp.]|nr:hypothetical protein [Fredinandcohnia sp.]